MTDMTTMSLLLPLLAAAVQAGTPLLLATLGAILTERAGVMNLGVEGMMSCGAMAGFVTVTATGSPWLAALAGCGAGTALAMVHGLVCLGFRGNQVVAGLALSMLGVGLAETLGAGHVGRTAPGFDPLAVPLLGDLPWLGQVFFRHDALVYLSYVLPLALWLFLFRTRPGLALQATGENPAAVRAAGLSPLAWRWGGVLGGGALCGLGGAYLSLAYTHLWTTNLVAGRGWIAVALVIFASWRPGRAVLGAWLFGGVMALQLRLQALGLAVPSSLLLMLPYGLTVLAMVLLSRRGGRGAPAALGAPLEPEGGA